jgi:putative endonuclease
MPSSSSRRRRSTSSVGAAAERHVAWHYRLRGYRVVARNVRAGGNELDLVVRRGRRLVICEVKSKSGAGYGDPVEAAGPAKARRVQRAAEAWLAARPELAELELAFEVAAVRRGSVSRVPLL